MKLMKLFFKFFSWISSFAREFLEDVLAASFCLQGPKPRETAVAAFGPAVAGWSRGS